MHTQTHIIMGAALGGRSVRNAWAGAAGGLLPDLPMLLAVLGLKIMSVPDPIIFGIIYWQEWMQVMNGIAHNFFLWGGLILLAFWRRERLAGRHRDLTPGHLVAGGRPVGISREHGLYGQPRFAGP